VRSLGADHIIDYREQDHFRSDAPYDIIIDCAGRAPWKRFAEVMSSPGHLAQPTPTGAWFFVFARNVISKKKAHLTLLKPNASDLQILIDHLAARRLRSVVGERMAWPQLAEAWALNKRGGTAGKIVLQWPVE
jgi:NADPH:quinone reductase-like Zn-dependent oxidoreductase